MISPNIDNDLLYWDLLIRLAQEAIPYNNAIANSIALKRLNALIGNGVGIATQSQEDADLKSENLQSMDTLIKFMADHSMLYNGEPIVAGSNDRGLDYYVYYQDKWINKPGFISYLNHLHDEIKDPLNRPLLNGIIARANQYLDLEYKAPAKQTKQPAAVSPQTQQDQPGQQGTTQKPDQQTQSVINMPLPLDGESIDFERIQQWLQAFIQVAGPGAQQVIRQASQQLIWLTKASATGWAPLRLDESLDTIYKNVKSQFAAFPQQAVNMPHEYLSRLLDLLNNLMAALQALKSKGYPSDRMDELNQQFQFAQSVRIQIGMWQSNLRNVQERIDGRHQ